MKKIIFSFLLAFALSSCDKVEIQKTNDTIKSADSLIKSAKESFKTLDSISVIVSDSARFNKVIKPEVEKHSRSVEQIIRDKAKNLDSINKELSHMKEQLEKGAVVMKSVDSAGKALRDGGNPLETLSETLNKVVKVTKSARSETDQATAKAEATETENRRSTVNPREDSYSDNPMYKTAKVTVRVNDVNDASENLRMKLRGVNGEIITENTGEQDGIRRQLFTIKVPFRNFEETLAELEGIGEVSAKAIQTEGRDYSPEQLCDIEITLAENYAKNDRGSDLSVTGQEPQDDKETPKSAFMKGFDWLAAALIFLLPFWPLFLILGIVLWFYYRNKRNKEAKLKEEEMMRQQQTAYNPETPPVRHAPEPPYNKDNDPNDDPYSKYKPK